MTARTAVLCCVGAAVLAGCTGKVATNATNVSPLVPVVAAAAGVNPSLLSDIAQAACSLQQAANTATDIATKHGSTTWATGFSSVSKYAGLGCAW